MLPNSFTDVLPATIKSMKGNKSTGTEPELLVRKIVRSLGYRYRINRKGLPGSPDLAFIGRRKVIFVHGCFWHNHNAGECKLSSSPKTRTTFWQAKFQRNKARDEKNMRALEAMGWRFLIIWECELKEPNSVKEAIAQFLK